MERSQYISPDRADGRSYEHVRPTRRLHELGQSLWLDNIDRKLLQGGLQRYIDEFSVTGLTSNPTIFDKAIKDSSDYDESIRRFRRAGKSGEELVFEIMLEDLTRAADFFRRIHDESGGIDGWVSLELSPNLVNDTKGSVEAAVKLHHRARRPNLFIKIPGTPAGIPAIEESIFRGIPINVTLLFSREQYLAAAEAYLRGLERRIEAGLSPRVASVASIFVSRWDVAAGKEVPEAPRNRLGIAVAKQAYRAYHHLYSLPVARRRRLEAAGAGKQRLLWASTGTKDPEASDTLYVEALAAPDTIDTMPAKTLEAFDDHGELHGAMPEDGGDAEAELAEFKRLGIKPESLAVRLQEEGAEAFEDSWNDLLKGVAAKGERLGSTGS